MTKEQIRNILAEAKLKSQKGFFVWASQKQYNSWKDKLNHDYFEFACSQILKSERVAITFHWDGFEGPAFIAASAQLLEASDANLDEFVRVCKTNLLEGPITLVPSNELSSFCL